jgi:hypothetical protein
MGTGTMNMLQKYLIYVLIVLTSISCDENNEQNTKSTLYERGRNDINKCIPIDINDLVEKKISLTQLEDIFVCNDVNELSNNINALVRYHNNNDVMRILLDVWNDKRDKHPGFSWGDLENPYVRVSVALTLFQLDKTGNDKYKDYIIEQLDSDSSDVVASASRSLGLIGDDSDIGRLESMILKKDIQIASSAIVGLGLIRTQKSRDALASLLNNPSVDDSKKEVINQVTQGLSGPTVNGKLRTKRRLP